jgi:hypothetical protein
MDTNLDEREKPVSINTAIVTLHDSNEVSFLDPSEGTTKYCRGFHVNTDGDLGVIFAQSSSPVVLAVKAGGYYPYSVKVFRSTGSTVGMSVVALR